MHVHVSAHGAPLGRTLSHPRLPRLRSPPSSSLQQADGGTVDSCGACDACGARLRFLGGDSSASGTKARDGAPPPPPPPPPPCLSRPSCSDNSLPTRSDRSANHVRLSRRSSSAAGSSSSPPPAAATSSTLAWRG
eukprot:scaffold120083_cov57-Phaeocystis_antarctica.AAC.1